MDEILEKLPPLEIPPLNIPIDIPALAHPAIVHFAIAIPVIVLLIEIFNTFFKKRVLSVTSLFMLMLLVVIALGAYLSGGVDGKQAAESLSSDAMATLKEHKLLGVYLVYASAVILFFKILSMLFNAGFIRFLFVLLLIGYGALSLYQGKEGGELVYKHGANVAKAVELDTKLFDLEDTMDDIKTKSAETIKALESNLTALKSAMPDTKMIEEEKAKLSATIEALTNEKSAVMKELNETKANSEATIKTLEAEKQKAEKLIETLSNELKEAKSKTVATPAPVVETATPVVETKVETPATAGESTAN